VKILIQRVIKPVVLFRFTFLVEFGLFDNGSNGISEVTVNFDNLIRGFVAEVFQLNDREEMFGSAFSFAVARGRGIALERLEF